MTISNVIPLHIRQIEAQAEFRKLAIARAESDFELKTIYNGYPAASVEWLAYKCRVELLEARRNERKV